MLKTVITLYKMNGAVQANALVYFLKRNRFLDKHIPDSVYKNQSVKNGLALFLRILEQLYKPVSRGLYLFLIIWLPAWLILEKPAVRDELFISYCGNSIFFLSLLLASFSETEIFKVTRDKLICLKMMKLKPRAFIKAALARRFIPHFFWYLPVLMVFFSLNGGKTILGLYVWLVMIAFRIMGEALHLFVYEKTGTVYSRRLPLSLGIAAICLAGAYLPLVLKMDGPFGALLYKPWFILVSLMSGVACLCYIALFYKSKRNYLETLDENQIVIFSDESKTQYRFLDVAMKSGDFKTADPKSSGGRKIERLQGYDYLNALFFARHRRQLQKPVIIRVAIILGIFCGGIILRYANPGFMRYLTDRLVSYTPLYVWLLFMFTTAEKACRALFYNCDRSLLRYGFYRQPRAVLRNFRIRLVRLSAENLVVGGALSLMVVGLSVLGGSGWYSIHMAAVVLTILLLSILFTVHHLFLYYVFQPYSAEQNVKNPVYTVINRVMSGLCFLSLMLEKAGMGFALGVLAFTPVYIAAAVFLVYRYAPKTFRLK